MPSSPNAVFPPNLEQPNSPDTVVPTITTGEETPGRESVVSLDRHHRREARQERQETDMLAVPDNLSRGGSKRFSLMRFRHASDSQLNQTAKEHAEAAPPLPPSIMRTAPTQDNLEAGKRRSTFLLSRRPKTPKSKGKGSVDTHEPDAPRLTLDGGDDGASSVSEVPGPPSYEDASTSQLAVPVNRASDSSRSDGSSGDGTIYAQTTTVTQTTHTTTTFFKLPRRKKDKGPLFPLPPRSQMSTPGTGNTPNLTPAGFGNSQRSSFSSPVDGVPTPGGSPRQSVQHSPSRSTPGTTPALGRSDSKLSAHSTQSGRQIMQVRGRASTAGSTRRARRDAETGTTPPVPASGRTSTSTAGRPSLAGLFNMSRLRQASEPALRNGNSAPGTPMSSESNPFIAPPKSPAIVVPDREEGDTPAKYLARLEEVFSRGALVPILSKTDNDFMKNTLRSYMRRFKFFEEPMDMAVRKLLMQVELPKETQQIDRTLQAFADRYHECNPGIFQTPDEAYFIAFSILILHTDVFNKNNKRKMQKSDYLKNTQSQGVAPEILGCFYDNTAYTTFIHLDEDTEFITEKPTPKRRRGPLKSSSTTSLGRQGQPVDPYALILDGKLDVLRVPIDDTVAMDDPFGYLGTAKILNHAEMRRAFHRNGIIQIVSSRSRPDAFATEATMHNPADAQVGVVDLKITKVGVLWRKDPKKRKTKRPWQEWGAILTGSQLYFFRNRDWIKSLMHQYENHIRAGRGKMPCVFKPAIADFKPDFLVSTEGMVALVDAQYRRHKNAFVVNRENIFQEIFLADSESELNDWLAKLNYAAAFRTTGVRMRGITTAVSGAEPPMSSGTASVSRPESEGVASGDVGPRVSSPTPAAKEAASIELAKQIAQSRRQVLRKTLADMEDKLVAIDKLLDAQLRTARHLSVLTPIQEKTRQEILVAASRVAANIRWERMKRWRTRSHRDILHIDLDEDLRHEASGHEPDIEEPVAPNKGKGDRPRLGFSRFNSKAGGTPSKAPSKDDKSVVTSPTATTKFMGTVEDLFRTPSRAGASKHQASGSWELPPLAFDRRDSTVPGAASSIGAVSEVPPSTTADVVQTEQLDGNSHTGTDTAAPAETPAGPSERDKQANGSTLKPPSPPSESGDSRIDEDAVLTSDTESNHTHKAHRHGFQKRLHSGSGTSFHLHRKHRGSSSTAGASDIDAVNASTTEEGLLRSPGSFTLHGKKASVVTFGSEWQKMSGEDVIRARKMTVSNNLADDVADVQDNSAQRESDAADATEAKSTEHQMSDFQNDPTPDIRVLSESADEGYEGAKSTKTDV